MENFIDFVQGNKKAVIAGTVIGLGVLAGIVITKKLKAEDGKALLDIAAEVVDPAKELAESVATSATEIMI